MFKQLNNARTLSTLHQLQCARKATYTRGSGGCASSSSSLLPEVLPVLSNSSEYAGEFYPRRSRRDESLPARGQTATLSHFLDGTLCDEINFCARLRLSKRTRNLAMKSFESGVSGIGSHFLLGEFVGNGMTLFCL